MTPTHCISCGAEVPDHAKFCHACGSAVYRPEAEAQPPKPAPPEDTSQPPEPAPAEAPVPEATIDPTSEVTPEPVTSKSDEPDCDEPVPRPIADLNRMVRWRQGDDQNDANLYFVGWVFSGLIPGTLLGGGSGSFFLFLVGVAIGSLGFYNFPPTAKRRRFFAANRAYTAELLSVGYKWRECPDSVRHFNRGITFLNACEYRAAYEEFFLVCGLDPDRAEAWFWRGETAHDLDQMLVGADKYLELAPKGRYADDAKKIIQDFWKIKKRFS